MLLPAIVYASMPLMVPAFKYKDAIIRSKSFNKQ